jgi:hypothetical protein
VGTVLPVGLVEMRGILSRRRRVRVLSVGRVLDVLDSIGSLVVGLLVVMLVNGPGLVIGRSDGSRASEVVVGESSASSVEFPGKKKGQEGKGEEVRRMGRRAERRSYLEEASLLPLVEPASEHEDGSRREAAADGDGVA